MSYLLETSTVKVASHARGRGPVATPPPPLGKWRLALVVALVLRQVLVVLGPALGSVLGSELLQVAGLLRLHLAERNRVVLFTTTCERSLAS